MCIRDSNHGGEDLWSVKIQEIRDFQCGSDNNKIPRHLADRLIRIYEKYKPGGSWPTTEQGVKPRAGYRTSGNESEFPERCLGQY